MPQGDCTRPYGSERSHRRYQERLEEWRTLRHQQCPPQRQLTADEEFAETITATTLRHKWKHGLKVSLNELIMVYIRHAKKYYVKNGQITREAGMVEEIGIVLSNKHGSDRLEEFGPVDLDNFRDDLITDRDWSRKYINKQITRVITMFKWAAKKEICSANIHNQLLSLGGLKKGRTEARETTGVTCVDDDIVEQTVAHLPPIVADMVRLQRLTGARPGEICSIRPGDVDRSGEVWFYRPDEHKTEHHEKDRIVLLGPQSQEILLPYLVRAAKSYCFSPAESVERGRRRAENSRVTPISYGNRRGTNVVALPKRLPSDRYKVASYRRAIRRVCDKRGIAKWTPNQLRHTAATMIRKNYGLEAAQIICGHETADVTQVYAERDLALGIRVIKEVG